MASTRFFLLLAAVLVAVSEGRDWFPTQFRRQTYCSDEELEQCVEPIVQLQNPISGGKLEDMDDEKALNAVCSTLSEAKNCIKTFVRQCYGEEMDLAVQTVEGVVGYMCSADGRAALLGEADCWKNQQLEVKLNECSETMQNHVFMVAMDNGGPEELCSLFGDLRQCARNKVTELCSARAATFIDTLLYHALVPAGKEIGCEVKLRITRDLYKLLQKARK